MIKRLLDFLFSFMGLIFLSPILVFIAFWIKFDSNGPIFFRQERVGLNGKIFKIRKFRSMHINSETQGKLTVGKDPRITTSGKFIRRFKVDELPQLIDVLLGRMSLVGPRPEVKEFIDVYPKDIREKILSVRPGITDMASIEMVDENEILGKHQDANQAYIDNILPIKQKLYLDYVENRSVWMDINIMFLTICFLLTTGIMSYLFFINSLLA